MPGSSMGPGWPRRRFAACWSLLLVAQQFHGVILQNVTWPGPPSLHGQEESPVRGQRGGSPPPDLLWTTPHPPTDQGHPWGHEEQVQEAEDECGNCTGELQKCSSAGALNATSTQRLSAPLIPAGHSGWQKRKSSAGSGSPARGPALLRRRRDTGPSGLGSEGPLTRNVALDIPARHLSRAGGQSWYFLQARGQCQLLTSRANQSAPSEQDYDEAQAEGQLWAWVDGARLRNRATGAALSLEYLQCQRTQHASSAPRPVPLPPGCAPGGGGVLAVHSEDCSVVFKALPDAPRNQTTAPPGQQKHWRLIPNPGTQEELKRVLCPFYLQVDTFPCSLLTGSREGAPGGGPDPLRETPHLLLDVSLEAPGGGHPLRLSRGSKYNWTLHGAAAESALLSVTKCLHFFFLKAEALPRGFRWIKNWGASQRGVANVIKSVA